MKRCARCKVERPLASYKPCKGTSDGLQSWCRPCYAEYERERRARNKDLINERARERRARENALANARTRVWRQRRRLETLRALGAVCACCGEARIEFLAFDHVDGGGNAHRRTFKNNQAYQQWLFREGANSGLLRVLCHNCNQARSLYGYCPHEREAAPAV